MTTYVLATANAHKAAEMTAVLAAHGIAVLPRPGDIADVDETSDTLEGNALLKARAIRDATGHAAVADDTGLFVDALSGAPGVYSARYAGPDASDAQNVAKVLDEMSEVADEERTARFRTVIAIALPDGGEWWVEGTLEGVITRAPRGEGGFGYDVVFQAHGENGRTLAELPAPRKNEISHRANALRALAEKLEA